MFLRAEKAAAVQEVQRVHLRAALAARMMAGKVLLPDGKAALKLQCSEKIPAAKVQEARAIHQVPVRAHLQQEVQAVQEQRPQKARAEAALHLQKIAAVQLETRKTVLPKKA